MASCDAADVQVKAFSPPFRRARETRTDAIDPTFCQAKENGHEPCPPGWCRCSGELRKQTETLVHPWGSPHSTPGPNKPPRMTKAELETARGEALDRRATFRAAALVPLNALIAAVESHELALAADEAERLRELKEWRDILVAGP